MWESAGERIKRRQRELMGNAEPLNSKHADTAKPPQHTNTLAQYQAALSVDVARLSNIKIMDDKQAAKRNMIATYTDFVWGYVEQNHNYPNNVAVQVMVWLFDVGNIEEALRLAFYLAPHQSMPERFARRDIQTFICDAVYDWAKGLANEASSHHLGLVIAEMEGKAWELSPPVASKVYVMAAKCSYYQDNDYQRTVELLEKAKAINPEGWGGKTLLASAKQRLPTLDDTQ